MSLTIVKEITSRAYTYVRTRCLRQIQAVIALVVGKFHQPVNIICRRRVRFNFANAISDAKFLQHLHEVVLDVRFEFRKTSNFNGIGSTIALVDGVQAFLPELVQLDEVIVVLLWRL